MMRASILLLFAVLTCGCSNSPGEPVAGDSPPSSVAANRPSAGNPGSNHDEPADPADANEPPGSDQEISVSGSGDSRDLNNSSEASDTPVASSPPPDDSDDDADEADSFDVTGSGKSSWIAAFPKAGLEVGTSAGQLVPEITGEDAEGEAFRLSDYKDKVIMLDFWGDW